MEEKFVLSQKKKTDFLEDKFLENNYKKQYTYRGASEVEDMQKTCMCRRTEVKASPSYASLLSRPCQL